MTTAGELIQSLPAGTNQTLEATSEKPEEAEPLTLGGTVLEAVPPRPLVSAAELGAERRPRRRHNHEVVIHLIQSAPDELKPAPPGRVAVKTHRLE
jgi:hypothetical protein